MSESQSETPKTISKSEAENEAFWDEEIKYASANTKEEFRFIIRNDKVTMDGIEYEFVPVIADNAGLFRKLTKEAEEIDQEKDWDKYLDNVRQRACLLIKDMTAERFGKSVFVNVENVVTGWSIRAREGFRPKLTRTSNGVPNGTQIPSSV